MFLSHLSTHCTTLFNNHLTYKPIDIFCFPCYHIDVG
nr:MAG TPA: hypothetical protein [Caudoviricetes sp.]